MLLNINTLSGCLPPIEVPLNATTRELKRRIQEVCPETANKRLRVMQRHEPSDEFIELEQIDQPLSSSGVSDGCRLSLVIEDYRAADRATVDQCLKRFVTALESHSDDAIAIFESAICGCSGTLDLSQMYGCFSGELPAGFMPKMLSTMTNMLNSSSSSISRLDLSDNQLTGTYLPLAKDSLASNLTITDLDLNNCYLQNMDADCLAEIIASNTTIQRLVISWNQISYGAKLIFDALTRNQSIIHFDMSNCYGNDRGDDDIACRRLPVALSSMITSNTVIQKLCLREMKLSEDCIKQMAEALQSNRTITDLDISHNEGTPVGMSALTKMIKTNSTIIKLTMCEVGSDFLKTDNSLIEVQLYMAFQRNTSITDLEIKYSYVSSVEAANAFAGIISSNITITRIKLPCIHDNCVDLILNALTWNRCLTDVTASFNMLLADSKTMAKTLELLSGMVRWNSNIVRLDLNGPLTRILQWNLNIFKLDLHGSSIPTHRSNGWTDYLLQNSTIKELDLCRFCGLNDGCDHSLANIIQSNSTLTKLNLQDNLFSNSGIESIANALARNCTITDVDISHNLGLERGQPYPQTARAIANMIASNSSIVYLNLHGFSTYFSDGGALALIAAALKTNTSITVIDLSDCLNDGDIDSNTAALALADMITGNSTIVKLDLHDNWFKDESLISIANALKTNASITEIDVSTEHQQIGDDVVLAFCDIAPSNQTLKSISFCSYYKAAQFQDSTTEIFQHAMLKKQPQFAFCEGLFKVINERH